MRGKNSTLKWMLLSEKRRNVWLREAGTLGGRARDGLGTAHIVGDRGDARWIDPAFYVLASLDPGRVGRLGWRATSRLSCAPRRRQ